MKRESPNLGLLLVFLAIAFALILIARDAPLGAFYITGAIAFLGWGLCYRADRQDSHRETVLKYEDNRDRRLTEE